MLHVVFFSWAGDNNQPPSEEIRRAAGVHLRWRHPHCSESFPEPQHLLSSGWPGTCPITVMSCSLQSQLLAFCPFKNARVSAMVFRGPSNGLSTSGLLVLEALPRCEAVRQPSAHLCHSRCCLPRHGDILQRPGIQQKNNLTRKSHFFGPKRQVKLEKTWV